MDQNLNSENSLKTRNLKLEILQTMNRLKQKYQEEVKKTMAGEFKFSNVHSVPKINKIVINMGIGEAKDNEGILEKQKINMAALAGQKPVVTRAKKSISSFKLVQGAPIGLMVTLRGEKMYAFLDKLINVVLPKVRDFRGVPEGAFDKQGNFNLGLREQIIFPEIDYKNIDKQRGLQITINTTAQNQEQGKKLLELFGMPFRQAGGGR